MTKTTSILAAVLLSAAALPSTANTLNFQQGLNGYTGTQDTNLSGRFPDQTGGGDQYLNVDAKDGSSPDPFGPVQALIRFDNVFGNGAGQINPNMPISTAYLQIVVTGTGSGFTLNDMLVNWDPITATWNNMGGGIQANGTEASATPITIQGVNDSNANVGLGTMQIDITASLKAVKAGTLPGYGWVFLPLMPNGTLGLDFPSADITNIGQRPLLSVTVDEPATLALLLPGFLLVGISRMRRRS